jgi:hypothetical protein
MSESHPQSQRSHLLIEVGMKVEESLGALRWRHDVLQADDLVCQARPELPQRNSASVSVQLRTSESSAKQDSDLLLELLCDDDLHDPERIGDRNKLGKLRWLRLIDLPNHERSQNPKMLPSWSCPPSLPHHTGVFWRDHEMLELSH